MKQQALDGSLYCPDPSCGLDDGSPAAVEPLITPSENLLTHLSNGCRQINRSKRFWWNEVNWKDKRWNISYNNGDIIQNYFSQMLFDSVIFIQILARVHSQGTSHSPVTCGLRDVWSPQWGVHMVTFYILCLGVTIGNPAKLLLLAIWWSCSLM